MYEASLHICVHNNLVSFKGYKIHYMMRLYKPYPFNMSHKFSLSNSNYCDGVFFVLEKNMDSMPSFITLLSFN